MCPSPGLTYSPLNNNNKWHTQVSCWRGLPVSLKTQGAVPTSRFSLLGLGIEPVIGSTLP